LITAGGAAIVVVVVLAVVVPRLRPAAPEPAPMQTVVLPEVPGYPYVFTWVPPPYRLLEVSANVGRGGVSFGTQADSYGDGYGVLISSESFPPPWEPSETSTVTVNGLPATLRSAPTWTDPNGFVSGPAIELTWQRDGMWISLRSGHGALDADQALQVAEGMMPAATPPAVRADIASVAIPTDWVLDQWVPDSVCATPNDAPPNEWGLISTGVCISVVTGDEYPADAPSSLRIDGDPAEINPAQLVVHRADGRKVVIERYYDSGSVEELPSLGLTDDLVIAMYRSVTFR
jgi:hypothetical protein